MWATLRPQLWTFACFGLLCRLLMTDRPRQRWWVPVLFAVWVNGHGGWVVGLGVLSLWAGVSVVARPSVTWRRWCPVLALHRRSPSCATRMAGHLVEFVARTVRTSRSIEEWGPLSAAPGLNWIPWVAAVVATVWIVRAGRAPSGSARRWCWRCWRTRLLASCESRRCSWRRPPFSSCRSLSFNGHARSRLHRPSARGRWRSALLTRASWFGCSVVLGARAVASTASRFLQRRRRVAGRRGCRASGVRRARQIGDLLRLGRVCDLALWPAAQGFDGWTSRDRLQRRAPCRARRDHCRESDRAGRARGLARGVCMWLHENERVTTRQWLATHGYRIEIETPRSFVAASVSDLASH